VLPVSYAVDGEKSSPRFASAFAAGCGGLATMEDTLLPGPVALFGSPARVPLLKTAIAQGRDWYFGDHGYFGRFKYYRVTKNAYQHDGSGHFSPERFKALRLNVAPTWNKSGSAVVICPNSPGYMATFGIDAKQWVIDIVTAVSRVSDRPIVVRWKAQAQARPIYMDLHDAWMTVVFSSASALDSLIAGVPVCTLASWAASYRMGITDISQVETPYYPEDREQFLFNLANQQWTLDEIRAGLAWKALRGQP